VKYLDEYQDGPLAERLVKWIHHCSTRKVRLMEFCGGHTAAILRYGIRGLMPETIQLLSGPGCPVCVTHNAELDRAIALAKLPKVTIATFGDMFKVPSSRLSLQEVKSEGADVRMVYSALDALKMAREQKTRERLRSGELGLDFYGLRPRLDELGVRYVDEE